MESLEHNCGNISPTICTNMLIFGKDTFSVLISQMILTNPISSQILVFMTSHFTTLFKMKNDAQDQQPSSTLQRIKNLNIKK